MTMDLPPPQPKGTRYLAIGMICGIICAVGMIDLIYEGFYLLNTLMALVGGLGFAMSELHRRRISARTITQLK